MNSITLLEGYEHIASKTFPKRKRKQKVSIFHDYIVCPINSLQDIKKAIEQNRKNPYAYFIRHVPIRFEDDGSFRRLQENTKDTPLNWIMIDIDGWKKDKPLKEKLIEHLPFVNQETAMLIDYSSSEGVFGCGEDYRGKYYAHVYLWCNKAFTSKEWKKRLNDFLGTKEGEIDEHLFNSNQAHFFAEPTLLEGCQTELTERTIYYDGDDFYAKNLPTPKPGIEDGERGEITSTIFSKKSLEHFNDIGKGKALKKILSDENATSEEKEEAEIKLKKMKRNANPILKCVMSCVMRQEDQVFWERKLIEHLKAIGSNRWREIPNLFRKANARAKSWFFLNELNETDKHNYIKLNKEYISDEGVVSWKRNGTIHIKSGIGSGKTSALKKLIADNQDKSVLYIGKNIAYVRNSAEVLGLDDYLDEEKFPKINEKGYPIHNRGLWKAKKLSICYPSLKKLRKLNGNLAKFDIVIIDEARQLLAFSATASILNDKHSLASYMGKLVKHADLVVCLDADLDNLTIKAIELHRGNDETFDVYWNQYPSLSGKKAYMCRSPSEIISLATELARKKKKFAIVGDWTPKIGKQKKGKYPIPYIAELLKEVGLEEHEIFTLHGDNSKEEEQVNVLKNPDKYLNEKLEKGLIAFLASPSITSGWSYKSNEKFDFVLGFYPHAILTANEIVQQLRRFRDTNDYFVWIKANNQHTGYEIENLEDIWEELYGYQKAEFEPINEMNFEKEKAQFETREEIRLDDDVGLDWRFLEVTKASKVSLCNPKLHFHFIWTQFGGITELSPYFDELWQQQEEGKEIITKDKKELRAFYELTNEKWNEIYQSIRRAKPINKKEYQKAILEN